MKIINKLLAFFASGFVLVSSFSCGGGENPPPEPKPLEPSTTKVKAENIKATNTLGFQCESQGEYTVDWGDGSSIDEHNSIHTYENNLEEATITITGIITTISFEVNNQVAYPDNRNLITSIELGNTIPTLPDYAFNNCSQLRSVIIPSSVATVGGSLFIECNNVTIYCEIESKPKGWEDNWNIFNQPCFWGYISRGEQGEYSYVVTKAGSYVAKYEGTETEIIIPNKLGESPVVGIGDNVFKDRNDITSIELPETIQSIGNYAFSGCTSLTSINLPAGLTSIGERAFFNCYSFNLQDIRLPAKLTKIDSFAFYSCDSFQEIIIPSSVTTMGFYAFGALYDLTIYCEIESKPAGWDDGWKSSNSCYWGYLGKETEGDYSYIATKAGSYVAKYEGTETEIIIPNKLGESPVVGIGDNVFKDRNDITSIELPETIQSIGNYAFSGCTSLTSINLPAGLISIGESAFNACALQEILIPASVITIDMFAFSACYSLTIYCEIESKPKGWEDYWNFANRPCFWGFVDKGRDGYYSYIATKAGSYISEYIGTETNLRIPDKIVGFPVISIVSGAFSGKTTITSVMVPETLQSIGDYAFDGCTSLSSINLPAGLTSIGEWAFGRCYNLQEIIIPASVTTIGKCAFYTNSSLTIYCRIEKEEIPEGWSERWNDLKYPCYWGYVDKGTENNYSYVATKTGSHIIKYEGDVTETEIRIPNTLGGFSVISVGDSIFSNRSALTSVIFPETLQTIGYEAFYNCMYLQEVNLPTGLISIGKEAFLFSPCQQIMVIPASVTTIGDEAFMYSRDIEIFDLTAFTDPNKLPSAGNNAFLVLPEGVGNPTFEVVSEEMRDAFISKGGGWPSDPNLYSVV